MRPINFEGANTNCTKPEGMTDDQCGTLPTEQGTTHDGFKNSNSCWMPNEKDIEAILAGKPVWLQVLGAQPPVALFTINDNNEVNPV